MASAPLSSRGSSPYGLPLCSETLAASPSCRPPSKTRCAEPCAQASPVQLLLAVLLGPRCIGCFLLLLFHDNPTRFHLFSYLATSPVWHFPQIALSVLSLDTAGPAGGAPCLCADTGALFERWLLPFPCLSQPLRPSGFWPHCCCAYRGSAALM